MRFTSTMLFSFRKMYGSKGRRGVRGHFAGPQRNMSPTNVVLPECAPQSGGKRPEPRGIAEKGPAESLTLFGAALLAQRVLAITRDVLRISAPTSIHPRSPRCILGIHWRISKLLQRLVPNSGPDFPASCAGSIGQVRKMTNRK